MKDKKKKVIMDKNGEATYIESYSSDNDVNDNGKYSDDDNCDDDEDNDD